MPSLPASPRLTFREWTADDFDLATLLWGDIEVSRYLGGPYTAEKIAERLERQLRFNREAGVQYWPLFLRDDGEFVGCCGLRPPDNGVYEHGFHLRPAFWGQGLGYEAAGAVVAHAFGPLGARGLWAGHHPDNVVSKRLLLKLGFQYTHMERLGPQSVWHLGYHLWNV